MSAMKRFAILRVLIVAVFTSCFLPLTTANAFNESSLTQAQKEELILFVRDSYSKVGKKDQKIKLDLKLDAATIVALFKGDGLYVGSFRYDSESLALATRLRLSVSKLFESAVQMRIATRRTFSLKQFKKDQSLKEKDFFHIQVVTGKKKYSGLSIRKFLAGDVFQPQTQGLIVSKAGSSFEINPFDSYVGNLDRRKIAKLIQQNFNLSAEVLATDDSFSYIVYDVIHFGERLVDGKVVNYKNGTLWEKTKINDQNRMKNLLVDWYVNNFAGDSFLQFYFPSQNKVKQNRASALEDLIALAALRRYLHRNSFNEKFADLERKILLRHSGLLQTIAKQDAIKTKLKNDVIERDFPLMPYLIVLSEDWRKQSSTILKIIENYQDEKGAFNVRYSLNSDLWAAKTLYGISLLPSSVEKDLIVEKAIGFYLPRFQQAVNDKNKLVALSWFLMSLKRLDHPERKKFALLDLRQTVGWNLSNTSALAAWKIIQNVLSDLEGNQSSQNSLGLAFWQYHLEDTYPYRDRPKLIGAFRTAPDQGQISLASNNLVLLSWNRNE